jgi:hypothetical protein
VRTFLRRASSQVTDAKALIRQLEALRTKYGSSTKLADELRRYPGFEGIDRSTIHRWLRSPPARAKHAIGLLGNAQREVYLDAAVPNTLWTLPSIIAAESGTAEGPFGIARTKYYLVVRTHSVKNGSEAIQLLNESKVDVALAGISIPVQQPARKICSLTKAYVSGISVGELSTESDFREKVFGYPIGSILRERIDALTGKTSLPYESVPEAVKMLTEHSIEGVFGWEPAISEITRALPQELSVRRIPFHLFGQVVVSVFVNPRTTHATSLRLYLTSLHDVCIYISNIKDKPGSQSQLAAVLKLSLSDLKELLSTSYFYLHDWDVDTLLTMWNREAITATIPPAS